LVFDFGTRNRKSTELQRFVSGRIQFSGIDRLFQFNPNSAHPYQAGLEILRLN